jgi:hypothetical protein
LIKAIGDRLKDNPKMSFTAGKILGGVGEYEKAAECFTQCMNVPDYKREACPLLIANAAQAAQAAESNLCAIICRDPEWSTLTRTFGFVIPGVTNAAATSTWQNLCIDLADQIEMTSELLTSSDELFIEKQQARNELNAVMRKLQKMLITSVKNHKEAVLAIQSAEHWWATSLALSTNYPASSMTDETKTWVVTFTKKQQSAKIAADWLDRATQSDLKVKTDINDYLKQLVVELSQSRPIRNVLSTMKKFYRDQRPTENGRKGLAATSELCATSPEINRVADDFSHL